MTYQFPPELWHRYLIPKYPVDEDFLEDAKTTSQTLYDHLAILLAGGAGLADGNKGDVVVSGGGTVWTLDTNIALTGLPTAPNPTGATGILNRQTGDGRYWMLTTDLLTQAEFDALDELAAGTNISVVAGVVSVESVFAARNTPIIAVATATETVNNSIVLQDDNELVLPSLSASAVYEISGLVGWSGTTTADVSIKWTNTGGGTWTFVWTPNGLGTTTAGVQGGVNKLYASMATQADLGLAGALAPVAVPVFGYLTTDANPGNLQLQWCQRVLEASDVVREIGSRLVAKRIV